MDCREFNDIVVEVARNASLDLAIRAQALAHAAVCRACADRLAGQQQLSAGLAALACGATPGSTTSRIEAALLHEFRARRTRRPAVWPWAAAIAAMILLAVPALRFFEGTRSGSTAPKPVQQAHLEESAPAAAMVQPEVAPQPRRRHTARLSRPKLPARRQRPVEPGMRDPEPAMRDPEPARVLSKAQEVATPFFALPYGASPVVERGQLVRMRLPRSTLLPFGFPLDETRASESVNADVLFGEDGLARAIRFVQ
jgi:hypothetical protein